MVGYIWFEVVLLFPVIARKYFVLHGSRFNFCDSYQRQINFFNQIRTKVGFYLAFPNQLIIPYVILSGICSSSINC